MKDKRKLIELLSVALASLKGLGVLIECLVNSVTKKNLDQNNYNLLNRRYDIGKKIGSGGMSDVFLAYDLKSPNYFRKFKPVAIKVLKSEFIDCDAAIYSLQSEYIIGQHLKNQSLVRAYDFVSDSNKVFLVMERLQGKTLNRIKENYKKSYIFDQKIFLLKKLVDSVAYIHTNLIVHGDLKPSNIFICDDGTLKIIDFGLSSTSNRRPPNTAYAFSRKFASPERILGGEPSYVDDVYALGCLAHVILTGRHPFGDLSSLDAQKEHLIPSRIFGLDNKAQIIIDQTLSFDPINRPRNAHELYANLSCLFT